MSRPANLGKRGWDNARKRQKELEGLRRKLQQEFDAIDVELDEIQQFIDLCAAYAESTDETPADQLQPQAAGAAEQGDGSPSHGDGTLPPTAAPCSAEEIPGGAGMGKDAGPEGCQPSEAGDVKAGEAGLTSPGEQRAPDSQGEGARIEAQPLARAGGGGETASPDDPTSQTAHPTQPGHCPTCRIVVSDFIGGTPAQCPDCGGPIEQDAPRPLTGGEPSLGAVATGEAPPAGTGSRTPSRHEGPLTEGPGMDAGSASTPARPNASSRFTGGSAAEPSTPRVCPEPEEVGPSARMDITGNGPEAAPYPEIPEGLRRTANEAAE